MTERLDGDTRLVRNPRIAFRTMAEGGGVLLHLDTGAYHSVNESGRLMWEAIDADGTTVSEMAQAVVDRFGISTSDAVEDVIEFVSGLVERDLVVVH
jgi:hypothetical protein